MSSTSHTGTSQLKISDLEDFTESLSTLMQSGLSLQRSIELYRELATRKAVAAVAREIHLDIQRGSQFSEALRGRGSAFPPWYIGFMQVGEQIGDLALVAGQVLDHIRQQRTLREKSISAMIYPAIVLGMISIGLVLLSTIFLPKIIILFSSFNPDAAVRMQASLNGLFIFSIVIILFLVTILILHQSYLSRRHRKTPGVAAVFWEKVISALPIFGSILKEQDLLRLLFSLRVLIQNGIPIDRALQQSLQAVNLILMRGAISRTARRIQTGLPLSKAFGMEAQYFPRAVQRWMKIGEETGDPEQALIQLYEYQKRRSETRIQRLMSLLEPALIIFVGAIIMLLVLQFIVPYFRLFTEVIK